MAAGIIRRRLSSSAIFLADRPSHELGAVRPTCPTGVLLGDIAQVLPARVIEVMRAALVQMDQKAQGLRPAGCGAYRAGNALFLAGAHSA